MVKVDGNKIKVGISLLILAYPIEIKKKYSKLNCLIGYFVG
jgi:hypothetical protein